MKGYVYFAELRRQRLIKIGFSNSPMERMGTLGRARNVRFLGCIVGDFKTEREMHLKFGEYRHDGERFRDVKVIREYIKNQCIKEPPANKFTIVIAAITQEECKRVRRIAKSERRSISQIVQFAIQIYLETYRKAAGK